MKYVETKHVKIKMCCEISNTVGAAYDDPRPLPSDWSRGQFTNQLADMGILISGCYFSRFHLLSSSLYMFIPTVLRYIFHPFSCFLITFFTEKNVCV